MIDFGREVTGNPQEAARREWLVTNGIGGYASGTVSGVLTRRYHGLLVAALNPPVGRTMTLTRLDEVALTNEREYRLHANHWQGDDRLQGAPHLLRFRLEGALPVWTYACGDTLLEKQVWMPQGANTTYIRYALRRGSLPLTLRAKAIVNWRDHHHLTRDDRPPLYVEGLGDGVRVTAGEDASFVVRCAEATISAVGEWYRGYRLQAEALRGLDAVCDNLHAVTFELRLAPGQSLTLVASTEDDPSLDGDAALAERETYERELVLQAGRTDAPAWIKQLVLAADQFIVRRPAGGDDDGRSVIAGYHWFADWGRDTMIALPGLTLTTGRADEAARILRTYAAHVDQGLLPNRFPEDGERPAYNTVDATLWYVEALRAYLAATGDDDLLADLFSVLEDIINWHEKGTRYGIHVAAADGLLAAGEEGVQLTWMDARVDGQVITPRVGKPVEINGLWYNALRAMAEFAGRLGEDSDRYAEMADRVQEGFSRYWNDEAACLFDVLDGPAGDDPTIRPNQLIAAALHHTPLDSRQLSSVVNVCARRLVTSLGVRSLDPAHPDYVGAYGGDLQSRDAAYHQGTVWGWLIGPFARAHLRAFSDPALTRTYLEPFRHHLQDYGVGSISEIADGDAPHTPRGAVAQAWSVAALLEAWDAVMGGG